MTRTVSLVLFFAAALLAACSSPTAPAANPCVSGATRSNVSIHCVLPRDTTKI